MIIILKKYNIIVIAKLDFYLNQCFLYFKNTPHKEIKKLNM